MSFQEDMHEFVREGNLAEKKRGTEAAMFAVDHATDWGFFYTYDALVTCAVVKTEDGWVDVGERLDDEKPDLVVRDSSPTLADLAESVVRMVHEGV